MLVVIENVRVGDMVRMPTGKEHWRVTIREVLGTTHIRLTNSLGMTATHRIGTLIDLKRV